MSDEPAKFILGDTGISAATEPGGRRFFRRRKNPPPPLTHCENCGAQLSGKYCAQCGQPAIDYRRSFRHVIVDVLDSFLNWDSKFVATIGWLVLCPWRLTNEFLGGRRVRYLHPLRLYLLASILFFSLLIPGRNRFTSTRVNFRTRTGPRWKRISKKKENLTRARAMRVREALQSETVR